jgi:hypothetical protein
MTVHGHPVLPVHYPYAFRLSVLDSAYDTVQLYEAQKNGGRLTFATDSRSRTLDQSVSFLRRASPFASLTPASDNI